MGNNLGNKETMARNIKHYMDITGVSAADMCKVLGVPQSTFSYWLNAKTYPRIDKIEKMANYFGIKKSDLVEEHVPISNVMPLPLTHRVPLVGTIACGDPILAQENYDGEVNAPEDVHADFALKCKGDSMINARIFDGDIVYIRQQETVDDGEIAAVLINDEATLKRVHLYDDHVVLEPENPQYRPLVYWGIDMNAIRILGKAVAFTSVVR